MMFPEDHRVSRYQGYYPYTHQDKPCDRWFMPKLRTYLPLIFTHNVTFNRDVIKWSFPSNASTGSYDRIYRNLLGNYQSMILHTCKRKDMNLRVARGLVMEEESDKIHFLITVNRICDIPGIAYYRLYLSNTFVNPTGPFRNIYKRFYKGFLEEAMEAGLVVVLTNDINALFEDQVRSPTFESFDQHIEYYQTLGSMLYTGTEEEE